VNTFAPTGAAAAVAAKTTIPDVIWLLSDDEEVRVFLLLRFNSACHVCIWHMLCSCACQVSRGKLQMCEHWLALQMAEHAAFKVCSSLDISTPKHLQRISDSNKMVSPHWMVSPLP
jgi:hypothetical protein